MQTSPRHPFKLLKAFGPKRQPVQDAQTYTLFKTQVACSRDRETLRENHVGSREGRSMEPVSIVVHTPFQYTSS